MTKQAIVSLIVGVVFTVLASTDCFTKVADKLQTPDKALYISELDIGIKEKGIMPLFNGASEKVVQGDSHESATEFLPKWKISTRQEADKAEEAPKVFNINKIKEEYEKLHTNKESTMLKEDGCYMNDVLMAFWHGVASVLIGEMVALLVGLLWAKIHKSNKASKITKERAAIDG